MTRQCKTCVYKDGEFCKRYPPTLIVTPDSCIDDFDQVYPEVVDNDWCGEYKKIYIYLILTKQEINLLVNNKTGIER